MAYDGHEDGRRDFHFLYGRWAVAHRRLKARGAGCTDWDEFEGSAFCQGLMGGLCNVDENDLGEHGHGLTFRTFDVEARRWSIYWVKSGSGTLGAPVHGRFENGVGRFEGDDSCRPSGDGRLPMGDLQPRRPPLEPGVLLRRRPDLGDQLGDDLHAERLRR